MKTKIYLSIMLVILFITIAKAQNKAGTLHVNVAEKNQSKEAIPFANVILYAGKTQIAAGISDLDGNIAFKNIAPGKYNLKSFSVGYEVEEIKSIEVSLDKTTYLTIAMGNKSVTLQELVITSYNEPLIEVCCMCGSSFDRTTCCYSSHCCCSCISSFSYGVIENEIPAKSLKYYPNPTNGKITLEANDEIEELAIVDENGKLREQYVINKNDKLEKDLSSYTNGLYILQYQSKGKLYREKILVIH